MSVIGATIYFMQNSYISKEYFCLPIEAGLLFQDAYEVIVPFVLHF